MRLLKFIIGLVTWMNLPSAESQVLKPLGPAPVLGYSSAQAELTFYRFNFEIDFEITNNGKVSVALAQQIDPGEIPGALECSFQELNYRFRQVPCTYNSLGVVTATTGTLSKGSNSIVIGEVKNPAKYSSSSFFKLCVIYNDVNEICHDYFGKVVFSNRPAVIDFPYVEPMSNLGVQEGSTWRFTFRLAGIYQSGNSVRFTFPKGFETLAAKCDYVGISNNPPEAIVLHNYRMVECRNIQMDMRDIQEVRILNMVNPKFSGQKKGFKIEVLQGTTSIVMQSISFPGSVVIGSGGLNATVVQDNPFQLSNTTYTFTINPVHPIEEGGYIKIKYSSLWQLWQPNCTVINGLVAIYGKQILCWLDKAEESYYITNFQQVAFGTRILVKNMVTTPEIAQDYSIFVSTLSQDRLDPIDDANLIVNINNTFGTSKEFRAHPVHSSQKLKAGGTGALEMTYFLKKPLPKTNVGSQGYIKVKIFPFVPKPLETKNGILKCIFFETVLASKCDYNVIEFNPVTNEPKHTEIKVYTPEDYDFQQSQIPITITTEGATYPNEQGLTIDPVIQRYLFHVDFYPDEKADVKPNEVYYQEWYPDSVQIPIIKLIPYIAEANEYAHFAIEVKTAPVPLPQPEKNYLFRLQFKGSSWPKDLGYAAGTEILGVPCYVENLPDPLLGASIPAGSNMQCDLYTRPDTDPYIQGYGIFEDIPANQDIILHFPAIKLGNVTEGTLAYLRFSLMEETPGMIDKTLELFYQELSFTVLNQSFVDYSLNSEIAVYKSNTFTNVQPQYNFVWTAALAGVDCLIYQIDKTAFADIKNGLCRPGTSQKCIQFRQNLQWMVIIPNPVLARNINTQIAVNEFITPGFQGRFPFKVRAMVKGKVINQHWFYVQVNAQEITTRSFDFSALDDVSTPYNYLVSNAEHVFEVKWTTLNEYREESFIYLTFRTFKTQGPKHDIYCNTQSSLVGGISGLPSIDHRGVLCQIYPGNIVQVYNYQKLPMGSIVSVQVRLTMPDAPLGNSPPTQTPFIPTPYPEVDCEVFYSETSMQKIENFFRAPLVAGYVVHPNNFVDLTIQSPFITLEEQQAGKIGPFEFTFSVFDPLLDIYEIVLTFATEFGVPELFGNDPFKCELNELRVTCNYASLVQPLTIQILTDTSTTNSEPIDYTLGAKNKIEITTEYISPIDGLVYPPVPGWYRFDAQFRGRHKTTGSLINSQASSFINIRPPKLMYFYVQHEVENYGEYNMFSIFAKIAETVPAYDDGGRIQIEFPTQDKLGNRLFLDDLGYTTKLDGTPMNSGDYVGCWFNYQAAGRMKTRPDDLNTKMKCRLIKSNYFGQPAKIDIINFEAITNGNAVLEMRVAKIKNPTSTALEKFDVPISISIFQMTNNLGDIPAGGYIYYDTYNLFMDLRAVVLQPTVLHAYTNVPNYWDLGAKVSDIGRFMQNPVYYNDGIGFNSMFTSDAIQDFYVMDLPPILPVANSKVDADNFAACSTAIFQWCITFEDINWAVVQMASVVGSGVTTVDPLVRIKKMPTAVPSTSTFFNNYVWQKRIYQGPVSMEITVPRWLLLVGIIDNVLIQTDLIEKQQWNRKAVDVMVSFTLYSPVPSTGAIEIRFNDDLRADTVPFGSIHTHCVSSVLMGSNLFTKAVIDPTALPTALNEKMGDVSCQVQSLKSWVLTGFENVVASLASPVIIQVQGLLDMPIGAIPGITLSDELIISAYQTQHPTDVYNNALVIARTYSAPGVTGPFPLSNLVISKFESMELDERDYVHEESKPIRAGHIGPLKIIHDHTGLDIAVNGIAEYRLYKYTLNYQGAGKGLGFSYVSSKKYTCYFQNMSTNEITGCQIIYQGEDNTLYQEMVIFRVISNTLLPKGNRYVMGLTTINGNGQVEGINYPTSPGKFLIQVYLDGDGNGIWDRHNNWYLEVYGKQWNNLKFISYVTMEAERNLFIYDITPNVAIKITDQIIVEIPTLSINNVKFFDNDGGYGAWYGKVFDYGDQIPFDIVQCTAPNCDQLQCRIYLAEPNSYQNLKFVCSNVQISTTQRLRVAFDIWNLEIASAPINEQYSVPAFVYSFDAGQQVKTNWQIVENAFYVIDQNPDPIIPIPIGTPGYNGDFNVGDAFQTSCNYNAPVFKFKALTTLFLEGSTDDAYILRFNFDLRNWDQISSPPKDRTTMLLPAGSCEYVGATDCAILKRLRTVIIFVNTNVMVDQTEIRIINYEWWNPFYRLHQLGNPAAPGMKDRIGERVVTGYAAYVNRIWSEQIVYNDQYPDITPQRIDDPDIQMDMGPIEPGAGQSSLNADYWFKIKAPLWYYVKKVVLIFGSNTHFTNFKSTNCMQHENSQIEISSCSIDTVNKYIWLDIVHHDDYVRGPVVSLPPPPTQTQELWFKTQKLAITAPTGFVTDFFKDNYLRFYTWNDPPVAPDVPLDPLTERYVCFTQKMNLQGQYDTPAGPGTEPRSVRQEYDRYYDDFYPWNHTQRAPFQLEINVPGTFGSVLNTANFHEIRLKYTSDIKIPLPHNSKDLHRDQLVCYINNNPRYCYDDTVLQKIVIQFQDALTSSLVTTDQVLVHFSSKDPNDRERDGFMYLAERGIKSYEIQLFNILTTTTYFIQSDPLIMYYTQGLATTYPHRGIEQAQFVHTSRQLDARVILEFTLEFDRADIRGLTFEMPTVAMGEGPIFSAARTTMFNLPSGSPFPCSRGLTIGISNPIQCWIQTGIAGLFGHPIRIHAIDFTYLPNNPEIFRFYIQNPDNVNTFEIFIRAWGGAVSYSNPYGDLFMGQRRFEMLLFTYSVPPISGYPGVMGGALPPAIGCDTPWTADGTDTYLPKLSFSFDMWVTMRLQICQRYAYPGTNIIVEFPLQDSSLLEPQFCEINPVDGITDYFELEQTSQTNPPSYDDNYYMGLARDRGFMNGVDETKVLVDNIDYQSTGYLDSGDVTLHRDAVKGQTLPKVMVAGSGAGAVITLQIDQTNVMYDSTYGNVIAVDFINKWCDEYLFYPWLGYQFCEVIEGLSIDSTIHRGEKIQCIQDNIRQQYRTDGSISPAHLTIPTGYNCLWNVRLKIWNFDTIDTGIKHKNDFPNSAQTWSIQLKIHLTGSMGWYIRNDYYVRFFIYANEDAYRVYTNPFIASNIPPVALPQVIEPTFYNNGFPLYYKEIYHKMQLDIGFTWDGSAGYDFCYRRQAGVCVPTWLPGQDAGMRPHTGYPSFGVSNGWYDVQNLAPSTGGDGTKWTLEFTFRPELGMNTVRPGDGGCNQCYHPIINDGRADHLSDYNMCNRGTYYCTIDCCWWSCCCDWWQWFDNTWDRCCPYCGQAWGGQCRTFPGNSCGAQNHFQIYLYGIDMDASAFPGITCRVKPQAKIEAGWHTNPGITYPLGTDDTYVNPINSNIRSSSTSQYWEQDHPDGTQDTGCNAPPTCLLTRHPDSKYPYLYIDYSYRKCDHGFKAWEWIDFKYFIEIENFELRQDKNFVYTQFTNSIYLYAQPWYTVPYHLVDIAPFQPPKIPLTYSGILVDSLVNLNIAPGSITELQFIFQRLRKDVGYNNDPSKGPIRKNIILIEFDAAVWINDLIYNVDMIKESTQINCKCQTGSSMANLGPLKDSPCYRRKRIMGMAANGFYNPAILIYETANQNDFLVCYVPEIWMPATYAASYQIQFHFQYPNCYTDYLGPTVNSFNNPDYETANFSPRPLPGGYPIPLTAAGVLQDPNMFFSQRQVGETYVGYFELIVQKTYQPFTGSGGVANPYLYWRPPNIGPIPYDDTFCTHTDWIFNPVQQFPPTIRIYNQVSPVVICQRVHAPTQNSRFRSGSINYMIPGKPAQTTDYPWDVNVFENRDWTYTHTETIPNANFQLDTTPLFEGKQTFYGTNRAQYTSTWAIQFVLNKHKMPIRDEKGLMEIFIPQANIPAADFSKGCMAQVENEDSSQMRCVVDTTTSAVNNRLLITVESIAGGATQLDTTNRIVVYFHIKNPCVAVVPMTLNFYYRYVSVIDFDQAVTQPGQLNMDVSQCGISVQFNWDRMRWYRFRPKIYMPQRSQFRYYVQHLNDPVNYYQDILLTYPDLLDKPITANLQCRIREWDLTVQKRYLEWPCSSIYTTPSTPGTLNNNPSQKISIRSIGFVPIAATVGPPVTFTIIWKYDVTGTKQYQYIISTIDDNDFVGILNVNEETIGTPAYNALEQSWMADNYMWNSCPYDTFPGTCTQFNIYTYRHYERFYHYLGKDKINLDHIYYTTGAKGEMMSIYMKIHLAIGVTLSQIFPKSSLEFTFHQLSLNQIPGSYDGFEIPCGLSSAFQHIQIPLSMAYRIQDPQCVVYGLNKVTQSPLLVRVQQFDTFKDDPLIDDLDHWFAFDDFKIPAGLTDYQAFDVTVSLYTADAGGKQKYEKYFYQVFTMDGQTSPWNVIEPNVPFLAASDYIFGHTGVTYPASIPWPAMANVPSTTRYDPVTQPTRTGGKLRLQFNGGIIGATNSIDAFSASSIKFFDQNGELQKLWFNPKTRRMYLSGHDMPFATPVNLEIRNVKNPYPYQRNLYYDPTNLVTPPPYNPHIIYDVYEGVHEPFQGLTPLIGTGHKLRHTYKLEYEPTIGYQQFVPPPSPDIEILDTTESHVYDSTIETSYGQFTTIKFRVQFHISNADLTTRMIRDLDFTFHDNTATVGALSIIVYDCMVVPARNAGAWNSLSGLYSCYVFYDTTLTKYRARIRDLNNQTITYNVAVEWDVYIRVLIRQATLSYTFSALVSTGAPELSQHFIKSNPNYKSTSSLGVYNGITDEQYVHLYREIAFKELFAESSAQIWRLRFRYRAQKTLIWKPVNTPEIIIQLPLGYQNAYYPKDPLAKLQCFFSRFDNSAQLTAEEIYNERPRFSFCTFDNTGDPWFYTIKIPRGDVFIGNRYFIHIRMKSFASEFVMPTVEPIRLDFKFIEKDYITTPDRVDIFTMNIKSRFSYVRAIHYTTTINNYDVAEVDFQVPFNVPAAIPTITATQIGIDMNQNYYLNDLEMVKTYADDTLPTFASGSVLPHLIEPPSPNSRLVFSFGQHTQANNWAPIRFSLINQEGLWQTVTPTSVTAQTYQIKIPMLKNPSLLHASYYYILRTYRWRIDATKNFQIPTIINEFQLINHNHVKDVDTDMGVNFNVISTNNIIQSNIFEMKFKFNYNINVGEQIMFQWKNNLKGVNPKKFQSMTGSNIQIEVWPPLYLVVLTATTNVPSPAYYSLGSTFSTSFWRQQWGFKFVYVNGALGSADDQRTIRSAYPTDTWLTELSQVAVPVLIRVEGVGSVNSVDRYRVEFRSPSIPENGFIEIELPYDILGFHDYQSKDCFIQSSFSPLVINPNHGPMECYSYNDTSVLPIRKVFRIRGFQQILIVSPATLTLKIEFFAKNLGATSDLKIPIITCNGQDEDVNTKILKYTDVKGATPIIITSTNTGPASLDYYGQIFNYVYTDTYTPLCMYFGLKTNVVAGYSLNTHYLMFDHNNNFALQSGNGNNFPLSNQYQRWEPRSRLRPNGTYTTAYSANPIRKEFWATGDFKFPTFDAPTSSSLYYKPHRRPTTGLWDNDQPYYVVPQDSMGIPIVYEMCVDSERSTSSGQPFLTPHKPDMKRFWLSVVDIQTTKDPNTNVPWERTYHEFNLEPSEDLANTLQVTTINKGAGMETALNFDFTMNYGNPTIGATPGDEIWIEFPTFNKQFDVFPVDLGLNFFEDYKAMTCAIDTLSPTDISNGPGQLDCFLHRGLNVGQVKPAVLKIPLTQNINPGNRVIFWVAVVTNPLLSGLATGFQLRIMTPSSRGDNNHRIPIYQAEDHYYTTPQIDPVNYKINPAKLKAEPNIVYVYAAHTFNLTFSQPVLNTDIILIQYPSDNHRLSPVCNPANGGYCFIIPAQNWIIYRPPSTLASGVPIFLTFNNVQNGWHLRGDTPLFYFFITTYKDGKLTDAFKVQQNFYDHYTTDTSIQIENTQTPNYFLKESYMNVFKATIQKVWLTGDINHFRMTRPSQITQFDPNYCNATLSIQSNDRQPYPSRFNCEIFSDFILLSLTDFFPKWDIEWYDFDIILYFQGIIDDQVPPAGIPAGLTDQVNVFGCVLRCENPINPKDSKLFSHVTQASQDFFVSGYPQPNLNQIQFVEDPFYKRQSRIGDQTEFYMLLRPNTEYQKYPIDQLVFTIPDEFLYPELYNMDCPIVGAKDLKYKSCRVQRREGKTKVILEPIDYDNLVKIIQISNIDTNQIFDTPQIPGTHYPITVDMYSKDLLVEHMQNNVSRVLGAKLSNSQPDFMVLNGLDENRQNLYEFSFKTGQFAVPVGYDHEHTDVHSAIHFVFEWVGEGFAEHRGYSFDIGTMLLDNQLLGCYYQIGTLIVQPQRYLACRLHQGTGPQDMPKVIVQGYEAIPENTVVQIYVTNLQSISRQFNLKPLLSTVKIGVQVTQKNRGVSSYLYDLESFIPDQTLTIRDSPTTNPTSVVITGSDQVLYFSDYQFTFTTGKLNVQTTDYIAFKFPKSFINSKNEYPNVNCADASNILVFADSDMIYIQPKKLIYPDTKVTFLINGVDNPEYALQGDYEITAFTYIDRQRDTTYSFKFSHEILPGTYFKLAKVDPVNSNIGGETDVTYEVSFITNHQIPTSGAISIYFPEIYTSLYDLQNVTCKAKGDVFDDVFCPAQCLIGGYNRIDIILINTQVSPTYQYTVEINGLTNPNTDTTGFFFRLTSWNDQIISQNHKLCEIDTKAPSFYISSVRSCTFKVATIYSNSKFYSRYTFTLTCYTVLKESTDLEITIAKEFKDLNPLGKYVCSSLQVGTLYSSQCILKETISESKEIVLVLAVQLRRIESQKQFTILVDFYNPEIPGGSYYFFANFYANSIIYAQADDTPTVTIFSNTYTSYADAKDSFFQTYLINIPQNAGISSTYIFKVPPVTFNTEVKNFNVNFPSNFLQDIGKKLKCSVLITTDEQQLSKLNYVRLLALFANKDPDSQLFHNLECSVANGFIVQIYGVEELLTNDKFQDQWFYYFIKGVFNPGKYVKQNFQLSYESASIIKWILKYPLVYFISTPPDYMQIQNITRSELNIRTPSTYSFKLRTQRLVPSGVRVGVLVSLPAAYDEVLPSQGPMKCSLSLAASAVSPCELYGSQVLIDDLSNNVLTQDINVRFNQLINPSILSMCAVASNQESYFRIRVINLNSNEIITSTSYIEDQKCMEFIKTKYSIAITGPKVVSTGLQYEFTIDLEEPARNMTITPSSSDGFIFIPPVIEFKSYIGKQKTFIVSVTNDVIAGDYTIKFVKQESEQIEDQYLNILNHFFKVQQFDAIYNLQPLVRIDDIRESTLGNKIKVKVEVEQPPAYDMNLMINLILGNEKVDDELLIEPDRVLINSQNTEFYFFITYKSNRILSPQKLEFSLTSFYKVVHQVVPESKFLYFRTSHTITTIPPTVEAILSNSLPTDAVNQVGYQPILSLFNKELMNSPNLTETFIQITPSILLVSSIDLKSTYLNFTASVSDSCYLYFVIVEKGSAPPTKEQVLNLNFTKSVSSGFGQTSRRVPQSIEYELNYKAGQLYPQTVYTMYLVAENGLGASSIYPYRFKTARYPYGSIISLGLSDEVNNDEIKLSLQQTLRISRLRINILTNKDEVMHQQQQFVQGIMYKPSIVYQICLAPDPDNDENTAISYVQKLQTDLNLQNLLANLLPQYDSGFPIDGYELRIGKTKPTGQPFLVQANHYNVTIGIQLWEDARLFGIILPFNPNATSNSTENEILSQQIFSGQNASNDQISPQYVAYNTTDQNELAYLSFNDLQDGQTYTIYLTAANNIPYDPPVFLDQAEVKSIVVKTVVNYNTDQCQMLKDISQFNSKFAKVLSKYVDDETDICLRNFQIKNTTASTTQPTTINNSFPNATVIIQPVVNQTSTTNTSDTSSTVSNSNTASLTNTTNVNTTTTNKN